MFLHTKKYRHSLFKNILNEFSEQLKQSVLNGPLQDSQENEQSKIVF